MDFLLATELDLPAVGEIRQGQVVKHTENVILVDLGAKSEGIIIGDELAALDDEARAQLAVGNDINVYIVDLEDDDGNIVLSYIEAVQEEDWNRAAELLASQEVFASTITGYNRGGVLVKMGHIRGFIPNSQLSRDHQARQKESMDKHFQRLIGQSISTKVIEVESCS